MAAAAGPSTVAVDPLMRELMGAAREGSARHQIFAFNIANALTPGFKPLRLPAEQAQVLKLQGMGLADKVTIEDELSKMGENQSRHDSYLRLLAAKRGIITSIIRQGR